MKRFLLASLFLTSPALAADDALVQFGVVKGLLAGVYDGSTTVADIRKEGDFGLGTFNGIDGEMIVVDGFVYRAAADGATLKVAADERSPFATVTHFVEERRLSLPPVRSLAELKRLLSLNVGPNVVVAIRIDGQFDTVVTRSVPKQSPPYRPLTEAIEEQQERTFRDVRGTLVGFYTPTWADGVNVPGWHLHFISVDRLAGGHLLDIAAGGQVVRFDEKRHLLLHLPAGPLDTANLNVVGAGAMEKVETKGR